jgi:basic amino acid/polyamine antiporter, APA family
MHDKNISGSTSGATNPDALLSRELGTRQLAANIFNYTVGTGIFVLPALAVLQLGAAAPLAWITCAVVMGLVVMCFAEAGSRVAATGGTYAYIETALGPFVGFVGGCLVLTAGTSAAAGASSLLARSILTLFPAAPSSAAPVLTVAVIAALVTINLRGVRAGSRVTELATVAKLLPLIAFVVLGAFFIDPTNLRWSNVPSMSAVFGTAGVVVFAFSGIEGSLVPSGEVKNPSRTVPRAIFLALGAATLLYLAVQCVALGILGQEMANERTTPLASAAGVIAGWFGSVLIAGGAVSMLGYLSANVLSEPRGLFALSRDGFLPHILTRVHPQFHTPHVAILVYGVILAAIALSGTFEQLFIFANLSVLMLYFLCAIAAWVLRRRDVRADGEPYKTPGGPLVPVAACAGVAWVFLETVNRDQVMWLSGVLALIFILYGLRAWRLRVRPRETATS